MPSPDEIDRTGRRVSAMGTSNLQRTISMPIRINPETTAADGAALDRDRSRLHRAHLASARAEFVGEVASPGRVASTEDTGPVNRQMAP